jgi:hypothetical protein
MLYYLTLIIVEKLLIAALIDWKEAFPRQCPKLGIESFVKCQIDSWRKVRRLCGRID